MPLYRLPIDFVVWYITQLPVRLLHFFINANLWLENKLAIRLHLRLFFAPLFHDRTIVGRFLSIWFRAIRVFGGTALLFFIDCLLAPLLCSWLLLPFLPLFKLYTIALWPIVFLVYALFLRGQPTKKVQAVTMPSQAILATTKEARALLRAAAKNPASCFAAFQHSPKGKLYLIKIALNPELLQQQVQLIQQPIAVQPVLEQAYALARQTRAPYITGVHVFAAIAKLPQYQPVFAHFGVSLANAEEAARWITRLENDSRTASLWDPDYFSAALGGVNRGWLGVPTPSLDQVGTDLTQMALQQQLSEVIGRDTTLQSMLQVLSRAQRENVLVIGEPGCGKTSVIYKLAQAIVAGNVPKSLFSKRLVQLNISDFIASIQPGETAEAHWKTIVAEIEQTGNIILFIDDIHACASISAPEGTVNMLALLKPYIASTKFQLIGATATGNYQRFIEPYKDFTQLFQIVTVEQVTEQQAIGILEIESLGLEQRHGVLISLQAIEAAIALSDRYIHDRVLPGKAYDLLDEACVAVASTTPHGIVLPTHIESVVEKKTNVPVHDAGSRERDTLLHLEAKIHEHMIDQETAVKAVADALRRARAGVTTGNRPIASFLFVGPTGVGKTELAKALAKVYFGAEETMVRFDMSEFQEQQALYRLLGTPMNQTSETPQPGQLTEAVRQKPFALLLFDEIEKAHPAILDLFLQILEDGRLTDSSGNTVTFKDTIIIATSNAGTQTIESVLGQGVLPQQIDASLYQILSQYFRLEFLNRFDKVVLFRPLSMQSMVAITTLLLKNLTASLHQRGYEISFAPELVQSVAQRGYDPLLGARPLRRLIQDEIESEIAKMILAGTLKKGEQIMLRPQYAAQAVPGLPSVTS